MDAFFDIEALLNTTSLVLWYCIIVASVPVLAGCYVAVPLVYRTRARNIAVASLTLSALALLYILSKALVPLYQLIRYVGENRRPGWFWGDEEEQEQLLLLEMPRDGDGEREVPRPREMLLARDALSE